MRWIPYLNRFKSYLEVIRHGPSDSWSNSLTSIEPLRLVDPSSRLLIGVQEIRGKVRVLEKNGAGDLQVYTIKMEKAPLLGDLGIYKVE